MPSSDSEDFESADEGHSNIDKKERKSRLSSSNYSENTIESDQETRKGPEKIITATDKAETNVIADGWDDFDIDEKENTDQKPIIDEVKRTGPILAENKTIKEVKSQDPGWDDFGDWGEDNDASNQKPESVNKNEVPKATQQSQSDIEQVTERLAAASTSSSGGWGWGWGVDSLLSTATAGISNLTSQVSQGISTVLETSLGAPDPEELARKSAKEEELRPKEVKTPDDIKKPESQESTNASDAPFPFGSLISGVTKFVETTGTKVLAGGLDTLETIGKKTMEVLQDGDPGLAKKRAMLGLDPGDKPVLSQVLREAKAKAEEEDRVREEKREAKEVHYENLFDDFEGLVHLEALEMLSRQVNMRIDERLRGVDPEKRQDIKETLQQVAELCEIPEEEDEEEECSGDISKADVFHERLQTATQDIGLKIQFQPLIKQYNEVLDWLSTENVNEKAVYKRAVSALAQATALSVEVYHKTAEMLLVKTRRSTADEADALTQMTVVLTKHISEIATLFTEKLNSMPSDNKEQMNTYITNVFLEAGNSSTYIQNAFQLTLPIIQIGAV